MEAERIRGQLAAQVKESGSIEQRITQAETETQELGQRLDRLDAEIAAHRKNLDALEAQTTQSRNRMLEINQQRDALQNRLREREKAIESGRQLILRLLGEASTLKNQLAQIEEYLAGIEREKARSVREEQFASAEIERLDVARRQVSETLAERQMELESVGVDRLRTEQDLGERRNAAAAIRHEIDQLKNEVSEIRARKESLEQVLAHRTYTTESVKRLFAALERGKASDLRLAGVMADFVEVDPQFEKPAEEFLHEELEYVVVESWQQAERGLDFIRAELDGRATFLVHPEPGAAGKGQLPEPAIGPETGIAARLSDSLRLTNGFRDRAIDLLPRVSLCFLAEDRTAAQRLAVAYPHLYFLLTDGVCYHGQTVTGGKKSGAGPLAMKREARELSVKLQSRQKTLTDRSAMLESIQQEIAGLEAELERLRALQQAREKDRVALDHEMRKLGDELSRANSRLSVARLELERLRRDAERSLDPARAQPRRGGREGTPARRPRRGPRKRAPGTRQTRSAGRRHRRRARRHPRRARRTRRAPSRRTRCHGPPGTAVPRNRRAPQRPRRPKSAAWGSSAPASSPATSNSINAPPNWPPKSPPWKPASTRWPPPTPPCVKPSAPAEEELKILRAQVQEIHERRSQIEVELVRKQAELKFLDETSRKELNCPVEELAAGQETVPDPDAIAEAEQQANDVRSRIEGLGAVNAAAMEEYQEAQQRQEFLTAQRQDLIDSIRDTEKAIQEIDLVSRRRFAEAFEAINANFRGVFQTLFGGGTGEMRLTDQENIAESGVEIVCSPPGKRLQNVLLLSGGEKALAAVALLMAIFKYQPSPFCVMDEVDAPLDESNIGRLTRLLQEMSVQTQFVVITHSKRTMEAAQALYGVTMQEPGVSRVVSVRFQATEAAPAA